MVLAPEHANAVKPDLFGQLFGRGNVLFPFAGDQMPKNGENNQPDQHPRGDPVKTGGVFKAKDIESAVHLEAGERKKNDQRSLGPVPEAFKTFIYIYTSHDH
jgi:hypothetical protein